MSSDVGWHVRDKLWPMRKQSMLPRICFCFFRQGRGICWYFSGCTSCFSFLFSVFAMCIRLWPPRPPPPPTPTHTSFFLLCLYYWFIVLRIFVDICLFRWFSFLFQEGFLWRRVFSCFHKDENIRDTGCQRVRLNVFLSPPLAGLDIPCRIGKDGGFIQRDRSFHLQRINWPSESRAMRDQYP